MLFRSSTLDVAASWLSVPSWRATSPTFATCADDAPATACIVFSALVKSIPDVIADLMPAPIVAIPPATPRAPVSPFTEELNAVPNDRPADCPARRPSPSA